MLTSIEVSHYKSISHARVQLQPINIVVGANGAGKSNFIDCIRFLHDCVNDDADTAVTKRHGIDSIRQWSKTRPYHVSIEVNFRNRRGNGRYKLVLSSNKGTFRIIEESGSWYGPPPRVRLGDESPDRNVFSSFSRSEDGHVSINSGHDDLPDRDKKIRVSTDELVLTRFNSRVGILAYMIFRPIVDELTSCSTYLIYPNTLRQPQVISRDVALADDGSNLSTIIKRLNATRSRGNQKDEIISALRYIMPQVTDILIKSAGGFYVPVLRVEEENGDVHEFNLSQISDGTLRCLGLLTAFYQPSAPDKIAIEEPEQMIHPGALPIIAEAVNEFANARSPSGDRQVFITTHSPEFLDLFKPEHIVWTRFEHGTTTCGSVSERQKQLITQELFSPGEILTSEGYF